MSKIRHVSCPNFGHMVEMQIDMVRLLLLVMQDLSRFG
jgi:hypothetical protein